MSSKASYQGGKAVSGAAAQPDKVSGTAPAVQTENGLTLLAARGQAAYSRSTFVSADDVSQWFKSTTDKGKLATRFQQRLAQLGADFRDNEAKTLRMQVFKAANNVLWCVPQALARSLQQDIASLPAEQHAAVQQLQDLFGASESKHGNSRSLEAMK